MMGGWRQTSQRPGGLPLPIRFWQGPATLLVDVSPPLCACRRVRRCLLDSVADSLLLLVAVSIRTVCACRLCFSDLHITISSSHKRYRKRYKWLDYSSPSDLPDTCGIERQGISAKRGGSSLFRR